MQFALVDGVRRQASTGARGACPVCGSATLAKCGPRILHHWAHAGRRNCDPWWENETPWHREWKERFPEDCREVSHVAPGGELHRADVVTPTGIVVEVQHSAMDDAERASREEFYGNLVWIVDGRPFRHNFDIFHLLPDPASELAHDIVWAKANRSIQGAGRGLFFRMSEARRDDPGRSIAKADLSSGWLHGIHEIRGEVERSYRGHHQYGWVRPRRTWLDATCPVYMDFGDEYLVRLDVYDESRLPCVLLVSKRKFMLDVMVETDARRIAARFHPAPASAAPGAAESGR